MTSNSAPTNGQAPDSTSDIWVGEKADEWNDRSVTKSYHRMEARKSKGYIDSLRNSDSKAKLEKLEDDERRIMECRTRLSKNPRTKKLQDELEVLFQKWWDETEGRDPEVKKIRHSRAERKALVKPNICSASGKHARDVGENDDPAHDVNAYFMFFKRHGDEWKGHNYRGQRFPKYEKFPNQRITVHDALHDDTHNPFKPIHDETGAPYLRYIHIPANHMGVSKDTFASVRFICTNRSNDCAQWIEVCWALMTVQ